MPTEWKTGIITPIYKGGSRCDPANYRPVTLLPVISKVMERIVCEVIVAHLQTQNILSPAQHGFRRSYSCVTNLITTMNDWTQAVDEGCSVHACYLDIAKAFDRLDHSILLVKLQSIGITGALLAWLENYLQERKAKVRIDNVLSTDIEVTSGVPQGSVLGPILFLVYINDMPKSVKANMVLFADDAKIWMRIRSNSDCLLLQNELDALHQWSVRNRLPFNYRKCEMLQIGRNVPFSYKLGSQPLNWTTSEKDLGVWVCGSLKNSNLCDAVFKRAAGG